MCLAVYFAVLVLKVTVTRLWCFGLWKLRSEQSGETKKEWATKLVLKGVKWRGYGAVTHNRFFFASGSYCRHVEQLIFFVCERYGSTMMGRVQWLFVKYGILIHEWHVYGHYWLVGPGCNMSIWLWFCRIRKFFFFFFLFKWESWFVYLFIVFGSKRGCIPTWMDCVHKMGLA